MSVYLDPVTGLTFQGGGILLTWGALGYYGRIRFLDSSCFGQGGSIIRIPVFWTGRFNTSGVNFAGAGARVTVVAEGGTAIAGVDYTFTPSTVIWEPTVLGVKYLEVNLSSSINAVKTIKFKLRNPAIIDQVGRVVGISTMLGSPSEFTVTIVPRPGAAGSIGFPQQIHAKDEQSTVSVPVGRFDGKEGAVSVQWETEDGTAIAGVDYTYASGTLNWANLDTAQKLIQVPLLDVASEKSFYIRLRSPGGNAVIGGGYNPARVDILPVVAAAGSLMFEKVEIQTAESVSLVVTVKRVGGSVGAVGCTYATSNGSAVSPTHYTSSTNTLSWGDGDAADKTFSIPIQTVPAGEARYFFAALSLPTGGVALRTGFDLARVMILDASIPAPVNLVTDDIDQSDTFFAEDTHTDEAAVYAEDSLSLDMNGISGTVVGFGGAAGSFGQGTDLGGQSPLVVENPANQNKLKVAMMLG